VARLADVAACRDVGLAGVIVGKAIYEGKVSLGEAVKVAGEAPRS